MSAEERAERLATVLRSIISAGGVSDGLKILAMNALEPGSGHAWQAKRDAESNGHVQGEETP